MKHKTRPKTSSKSPPSITPPQPKVLTEVVQHAASGVAVEEGERRGEDGSQNIRHSGGERSNGGNASGEHEVDDKVEGAVGGEEQVARGHRDQDSLGPLLLPLPLLPSLLPTSTTTGEQPLPSAETANTPTTATAIAVGRNTGSSAMQPGCELVSVCDAESCEADWLHGGCEQRHCEIAQVWRGGEDGWRGKGHKRKGRERGGQAEWGGAGGVAEEKGWEKGKVEWQEASWPP
ncbi:unnamed protein product [Closterium sp. NIES-64]|nr:unnamed protein product [Closterium sp. NIES-64]